MKLEAKNYALSIHDNLIEIIRHEMQQATSQEASTMIILNFRDPGYSASKGGFHPVEIAVDSDGKIMYITDFSYDNGGDMAELVKELDFDFQAELFQQSGTDYPIERASKLFQIWQQNFCCYYRCGVFQVSVTHV